MQLLRLRMAKLGVAEIGQDAADARIDGGAIERLQDLPQAGLMLLPDERLHGTGFLLRQRTAEFQVQQHARRHLRRLPA